MNEDITCPSPLEMLRRGSPVVHHDGIGVVCYISGDAVGVFNDWLGVVRDRHPGMLKMDLTDATGRAHAAWWAKTQAPQALWLLNALGLWLELGWCDEDITIFWEALIRTHAVHGLDPADDTRLPDGSRVVDALALRAVVLHLIAKMEQTP